MAGEAFAGSLCEGELGALLFFSIDAAVPDLGLVPRVMTMKDYIQNFFCVRGKIRECLRWLSVFQEEGGGPGEASRLKLLLLLLSDCSGSDASMVITWSVFVFCC